MQQRESRGGRCRRGTHAGTVRRGQVRLRTAGGAAGRTGMLRTAGVPQAAARRTTTAGAVGVAASRGAAVRRLWWVRFCALCHEKTLKGRGCWRRLSIARATCLRAKPYRRDCGPPILQSLVTVAGRRRAFLCADWPTNEHVVFSPREEIQINTYCTVAQAWHDTATSASACSPCLPQPFQ